MTSVGILSKLHSYETFQGNVFPEFEILRAFTYVLFPINGSQLRQLKIMTLYKLELTFLGLN
jgi:hypothetical protein